MPDQAGDVTLGQLRLIVGPYDLVLDYPQWGFSRDTEYLEEQPSITPYGVVHRRPYGIARHGYATLRFPRTEAFIESLRTLSHYAGRTGAPVYLVLDAGDTNVYWWVDWPAQDVFRRLIENREEITLTILQQSSGVPT